MAGGTDVSQAGLIERQVEEYLTLRRKLGTSLETDGALLRAFARWAERLGHRGPVKIALALQWAKLPQRASPQHWARRLSAVRQFARYRVAFDPGTEVPPRALLGSRFRRRDPHIYSEEEIGRLLVAAANLEPAGGLRSQTYAVLLGLLASTGLRVCEALRLTCADVDLGRGVLTVSGTKFHKSRLVPVHVSTGLALTAYAAHRDRFVTRRPAAPFFVADPHHRLSYDALRRTFASLRRRLELDQPVSGRRPRIYDLRHTFACRCLMAWYREGVGLECKLASLSTYLGHVRVTDTYWYLTAVPELMALAAERFERSASALR